MSKLPKKTKYYDGNDPLDLRNPTRWDDDILGWAKRQIDVQRLIDRNDEEPSEEDFEEFEQKVAAAFAPSREDQEITDQLRRMGHDVDYEDWEEMREVQDIKRRAGL